MNDAFQMIYYILEKFLDFVFGAYIFRGVSIGMLFVVAFVFSVLLTFVIAIPKVRVGGAPVREEKGK